MTGGIVSLIFDILQSNIAKGGAGGKGGTAVHNSSGFNTSGVTAGQGGHAGAGGDGGEVAAATIRAPRRVWPRR